MKIYTRIILDKDDNVIKQNYFDYDGPLSYCGNGGGGNGNDSDSGSTSSSSNAAHSEDMTGVGSNNADAEWDMTGVGDNSGKTSDSGGVPEWESGSPENTYAVMSPDMAAKMRAETARVENAYTPPAATEYTGDNEGDVAMETQHYQDWKSETQTPQYPTENGMDNETQLAIDREFAIKKGLKTELSDGSLIDGPNARNSEGIIVDRNDPSIRSQDLTFKEHWDNAPGILKYSPTLRLLYAGGKNLGEWARSKGWNWDSTTGRVTDNDGNEISESDMHGATASQAPHIAGGTTTSTAASTSPSSVWFNNLSSSQSGFNLKSSYANAKAAVSQRLGKPSSVGLLAVNDSSYYNWLKDNSLNKGIL